MAECTCFVRGGWPNELHAHDCAKTQAEQTQTAAEMHARGNHLWCGGAPCETEK